MKFSVDTKNKKLTLLEEISFREIEKIKKFIGDDWREWTVCSEQVKEFYWQNWYWWLWSPQPHISQPPVVTYGGPALQPCNVMENLGSTIQYGVSRNSSDQYLLDSSCIGSTFTLADLLKN